MRGTGPRATGCWPFQVCEGQALALRAAAGFASSPRGSVLPTDGTFQLVTVDKRLMSLERSHFRQ